MEHGLLINLDPKDGFYKFHDLPRHDVGLIALIAQTNDGSKIWHGLKHLNFHILKMMIMLNMVMSLPKVVPSNGVCEVCVRGKHH